jgi:hypothetical protein
MTSVALTQAGRGRIIAAVGIVAVVAGTAESAVANRMVGSRAKDLRADLVRSYEGTTRANVGLLGLDGSLAVSGHSPESAVQIDGGVRARYRVRALTESRCVTIVWDDHRARISPVQGC